MKQATCAQLGGPATCAAGVSGNPPEEMADNGMKHVEAEHPEMAADIKKMSAEETKKWMDDFRQKWNGLPEA